MEAESSRVARELVSSGFAVCRGVLPHATVERARAHLASAVDSHLRHAIATAALTSCPCALRLEERLAAAYAEDPERAPVSWASETRCSFVFQGLLFRDPTLCQLVEAITGRPAELASRYNVRSKLPAALNASFPWHQDHAFFRMQYLLKKQPAKRLLAVWAPLVPVSESNGAVEVAAGSHVVGLARHRRSGGFLAAEAEPSSAFERVIPSLSPGDLLLFTDLTMHRSGLNRLSTVRWSADWAYELEPADAICPPLTQPSQRLDNATAEVERASGLEHGQLEPSGFKNTRGGTPVFK
ncbi:MAG: hypothetical protein SGPRY_012397 [Prymnesium sp.]